MNIRYLGLSLVFFLGLLSAKSSASEQTPEDVTQKNHSQQASCGEEDPGHGGIPV